MVVEGSQQSFMHSFLEVWISRTYYFPSLPIFQLHAIKGKHHVIGFQIPIDYLWISAKLLSFSRTERFGLNVESRLKGIGENPLDERVISLKFIIICVPKLMHFVNIFTIRLGLGFAKVEKHIDIVGRLFLFDNNLW